MHFWLAFSYFCCLFSVRYRCIGAGVDNAVFCDTPKLNTSNGANLRRSETSSYPPFESASSAVSAVRAVWILTCRQTRCHRNTFPQNNTLADKYTVISFSLFSQLRFIHSIFALHYSQFIYFTFDTIVTDNFPLDNNRETTQYRPQGGGQSCIDQSSLPTNTGSIFSLRLSHWLGANAITSAFVTYTLYS